MLGVIWKFDDLKMRFLGVFLVLILCFSCQIKEKPIVYSQNTKEVAIKDDLDLKENLTQIEPDLFVIDKRLSEKFMSGENLDFFQSEADSSKLFFVPYTDGSITTAILTKDNLPDYYKELLSSEKLNISDSKLKPISISKIISKKGILINSSKNDVLSIFGTPDKTNKENNLDILEWNFVMKEFKADGHTSNNLQPFILDSLNLEFTVNIFFKDDSIQTLIYEYEVP